MDSVTLLQLFKAVPWGTLLVRAGPPTPSGRPAASLSPPPRQLPTPQAAGAARPGCQVADTCLLAYGYLEELAAGSGGYGVLAHGRRQLEDAAGVARSIGQADLAQQLLAVAEQMPQVHTPQAAAKLARELEPVKRQAWRLGRACGLAHRE